MGLYWECDVINDLGYPEWDTTLDGRVIYYDYSAGCEMFCAMFLASVAKLCPVATGHLLYSVNSKSKRSSMTCWTYCDYAQYVEYGTVYMQAQSYFEPSLNVAYDIAAEMWNDEVNNVNAYLDGDIDISELGSLRQTAKAMAVGLFNTILGFFTAPLEEAMAYPSSPGVRVARNLAEGLALYTLADAWLSTGSQMIGTLAGMLVGFGVFVFIAPLFDVIFEMLNDSRKRQQEREAKQEGTGRYALLPAVEII